LGSASGISLTVFGIMITVASLFGWFYLAFYCNPVAYSQFGPNQTSRAVNGCLTFYSVSQLRGQGLASYPPMISLASIAFGIVLVLCGTVLIAVKQN